MCSNIGPKDVLSTLYCGIQYTVSHIVPNVLGHQGIPCIQKSCRNNNTTEIISVVNNNITEVICCSEHSHRATENVDGGIRATERESFSKQILARIHWVQKNFAFGFWSKSSLLSSRNRVLCDCLWTEVVFVSGLSEAGTQAGFSLYR